MTNTTQESKLVFHTQHRENYAAHDWDGTGECPQHWKSKGGSTYVVTSPTLLAEIQGEKSGTLNILRDLISHNSDYSEEFIARELTLPADAVVCADWETPTTLYRTLGGQYRGRRVEDNTISMTMRHQIKTKIVDYALCGDDAKVSYDLTNGVLARSDEELRAELINMGVKF